MKIQVGPSDIFFPIPAALIVCGDDSKWNVLTVAWIGMVDTATVGIALEKKRYSLDFIRKSKKFTVNISPAELYKETDYCGIVSGKDSDKFSDTKLTPITDTMTGTAIIKECPLNMECELIQEIPLDDCVLLLGKIVQTHIDEDKAQIIDNQPKIDASKMNPVVFFATVDEYWSIGKKLGNAFEAGKEFIKRKS